MPKSRAFIVGPAALLLLAILGLAFVPGCSGCRRTPEELAAEAKKRKEEEERRKKEEEMPDFEIGRVTLQPADRTLPSPRLKPGHWVGASQRMKANKYDFFGDLETAVVNQQGQPIDLDRTPYRITTTRKAALPKGQQKYLETTFFVPHASRRTQVLSVLRGRHGAGEVSRGNEMFSAMPPYQYYFVVLADAADRFTYVSTLDSVRLPWNDENQQQIVHYQVVAPRLARPVSLPTHPLTWTSIAYVLWDDVDPDLLSNEQQQAMLDWLHWGGQLIVAGPDSLDRLADSFLAPYLPATAGSPRDVDTEALRPINAHWSLSGVPPLAAARPWSGITLRPRNSGTDVTGSGVSGIEVPGTGGLLVEGRIGRGRIVVTAFRLDQRDLVSWKGFDNFFNACLLRRPARFYAQNEFGEIQLRWLGSSSMPIDSAVTSQLRFFTRDAGRPTEPKIKTIEEIGPLGQQVTRTEVTDPVDAGGVASWNPLSLTAESARESLRAAAGITVPDGGFVVRMLCVYLLILVPLNWLLFWSIGRVELAWVAAPVIAIVCSFFVIRLAQLDIGFARAQTEVAVLEVQGEYPRAHLTRYTALYTALSTYYDLEFDDSTALAQPFPVDTEYQLLSGQRHTTVTFRRMDDVHLDDLLIPSNSTGMVHSEQMLELDGPIKLTHGKTGLLQVFNGSQFPMRDVAVVRRPRAGGSLQSAWVGDLPAGNSATLEFSNLSGAVPTGAKSNSRGPNDEGPSLDLTGLARTACRAESFRPGDARLVGRIDEIVAGASIRPSTNQVRSATLVLANLRYGPWDQPATDGNSRAEMKKTEPERFSEDFLLPTTPP